MKKLKEIYYDAYYREMRGRDGKVENTFIDLNFVMLCNNCKSTAILFECQIRDQFREKTNRELGQIW